MLTKKQRDLARAMYESVLDEEQIRRKHGISRRQMKRWAQEEEFQRELHRLCENSMRETKFILIRYGPIAAWKLVELLNGDKPDITRRAALDLIDRCVQSNELSELAGTQIDSPSSTPLTEEQALRILETLSRGVPT